MDAATNKNKPAAKIVVSLRTGVRAQQVISRLLIESISIGAHSQSQAVVLFGEETGVYSDSFA
jgi:hypothetical protein